MIETVTIVNSLTLYQMIYLQASSNFTAFADDKINVTEKLKFVFGKGRKHRRPQRHDKTSTFCSKTGKLKRKKKKRENLELLGIICTTFLAIHQLYQGFSRTVPFAGPRDSTSMIMGVLA